MHPDLDAHLRTIELLDCQGRVEHRLTLLIDGRVRVDNPSATFTIDLERDALTGPGGPLPSHLLHAATELAGRPLHQDHARHDHAHRGR